MSPLICLDCVQLPVFLSLKPFPCWGDLPCLLTDNSDRKLLHVITLLKSQFTQPQQIILRWVPGVMETVFNTLCPASPALSKPRQLSVVGWKNNFLSSFLLHVLPFFSPTPSLSSFFPFNSLYIFVPPFLLPLVLSSGFRSKGLQCVSSGWHRLLLNWTLYR